MNKDAMKILCVLWWTYAFVSLGHVNSNGIATSQGKPVFGITRN